jgi:hypothetical protein
MSMGTYGRQGKPYMLLPQTTHSTPMGRAPAPNPCVCTGCLLDIPCNNACLHLPRWGPPDSCLPLHKEPRGRCKSQLYKRPCS